METVEKNMVGSMPKVRLAQYLRIIPELLVYELVSKAALFGLVFLIKKLMMWAVLKSGHVAVTSGDFLFIFKSPFGWLVIVSSIVLLGIYVAFDINVIVNYAGEKVCGRPTVLWRIIFESLTEATRFFTPGGLLVLLFAVLITPVIGVGMSISLTSGLYVPNFVSSVIESTPLYNVLYTIFEILMVITIFFGMFTIPGMIIDHISPMRAFWRSIKLVVKNFKKIILQLLLFNLKFLALAAIFLFSGSFLSLILTVFNLGNDNSALRLGTISLVFFLGVIYTALTFIYFPLITINIIQLYQSFKDEVREDEKQDDGTVFSMMLIVVVICYVLGWGVSYWISENSDWLFVSTYTTNIVCHRGGGFEGGENTIPGIQTAIDHKCFGVEIDIQRTKDGYYVLNHDNSFARVAGVGKSSDMMNLAEIKKLELINEPGTTIPTIEEVLDVTHDNITLFIELKGKTADKQMCEDMVKLLKERHMEDECVLISLKYELIEYIEDKYPEMQTGYLTFLSLGNTADLKCDYIGLEEESVIRNVIESVHEAGTKLLVWTPNSYESQNSFIMSEADGIITDNITQAEEIVEKLENRDNIEMMFDSIGQILG